MNDLEKIDKYKNLSFLLLHLACGPVSFVGFDDSLRCLCYNGICYVAGSWCCQTIHFILSNIVSYSASSWRSRANSSRCDIVGWCFLFSCTRFCSCFRWLRAILFSRRFSRLAFCEPLHLYSRSLLLSSAGQLPISCPGLVPLVLSFTPLPILSVVNLPHLNRPHSTSLLKPNPTKALSTPHLPISLSKAS